MGCWKVATGSPFCVFEFDEGGVGWSEASRRWSWSRVGRGSAACSMGEDCGEVLGNSGVAKLVEVVAVPDQVSVSV